MAAGVPVYCPGPDIDLGGRESHPRLLALPGEFSRAEREARLSEKQAPTVPQRFFTPPPSHFLQAFLSSLLNADQGYATGSAGS